MPSGNKTVMDTPHDITRGNAIVKWQDKDVSSVSRREQGVFQVGCRSPRTDV